MVNYHYIVDLSYIIFYSGYSAFNSYASQMDLAESQMNSNFDPTIDDEFCYYLTESIKHNIVTPAQQVFPLVDKSKFIFCTDCSRKNIWRRDVYPEYKINRDTKDTSKDKFNMGKVFEYAHKIVIPNIIDEFNCLKVSCGCAEGDDVIAVLANHILNENKNNKIVIISSDRDMIQLCQDRLVLITANGVIREPKADLSKLTKIKFDDDEEITAKDFLLFKILLGDPSDNIPNIKPGIGPKKAYKLLKDRNLLKTLLAEDISIADSFKRNKQLISMNEIPQDVQTMILEEYTNVLDSRDHII